MSKTKRRGRRFRNFHIRRIADRAFRELSQEINSKYEQSKREKEAQYADAKTSS